MKKLFLLVAVLFAGIGLKAQNNTYESTVISPDSLYYTGGGGCCPTINFILIENKSDETLIINGMHSDAFYVECIYKDINVAEDGLFVAAGESAELSVTFRPLLTGDHEGTMIIDTDFGDYSIYLYYEETLGLDESHSSIGIYPNPAKDVVTIESEDMKTVSIFNALGQKMDEFATDGNRINVSTSKYDNGVYFIKINGTTTQSMVISH